MNRTVFCDVHRVVRKKGTDVLEEPTASYSCSEKVPPERWYLCTKLCSVMSGTCVPNLSVISGTFVPKNAALRQIYACGSGQQLVRFICKEVGSVVSGACVQKYAVSCQVHVY